MLSLMDSNISLFHAFENHTMAFCGLIKLERWNWLLRPLDNMSQVAVSRALGEGVFSYDFTWRTNSDIVRIWVGCLVRVGVGIWDII